MKKTYWEYWDSYIGWLKVEITVENEGRREVFEVTDTVELSCPPKNALAGETIMQRVIPCL